MSIEKAWKMPPPIKVYEAFGAIADGRVKLISDRQATVASSDESKTYTVIVADEGREISSNDNASYWQGYLGYPPIAVLIARGFISVPNETMTPLASIQWKDINRRLKDYAKAMAEADRHVVAGGGDPTAIHAEAEKVIEALRQLRPYQGKRIRPP
jgi:hypothetical protein